MTGKSVVIRMRQLLWPERDLQTRTIPLYPWNWKTPIHLRDMDQHLNTGRNLQSKTF